MLGTLLAYLFCINTIMNIPQPQLKYHRHKNDNNWNSEEFVVVKVPGWNPEDPEF